VRRVAAQSDVWVIFDNTAAGAAAFNARRLMELLGITVDDARRA
jgi:uncharacterized protein YecE (DUF72 family)